MFDPNELSIGAGVWYFDRFEGGVRTGEVDLGNASSAAFAPDVQTATKHSSRTGARAILREVVTQQGGVLSITVDSLSQFNLALFTHGTQATFAQGAGTVTGEALTAKVKKGRYFPTLRRSISAVVVKQGATTLVANTDYSVDASTGRIYFLPGGAATENVAATVDYSYATVSLESVNGLVTGLIEGYLRFKGDPAAGPVLEAEFWKVVVKPNGELPFITDDFAGLQLNFTVLDDSANHPGEPFFRALRTGVR